MKKQIKEIQTAFRFTVFEKGLIDQVAKAENISRNELVRRCVFDYINRTYPEIFRELLKKQANQLLLLIK